MRRFLKAHKGRAALMQTWGVVFRGEIEAVGRDSVVLKNAQALDESARDAQFKPVDGQIAVPYCQIRYVQVAP